MNALTTLENKRFDERSELEHVIINSSAGRSVRLQAAEELATLKANYADAQKRLVDMTMNMPCGHLARYAVNSDEGTGYCLMCDRNAVTAISNIIPKAIEKISAELVPFKGAIFEGYNKGINDAIEILKKSINQVVHK